MKTMQALLPLRWCSTVEVWRRWQREADMELKMICLYWDQVGGIEGAKLTDQCSARKAVIRDELQRRGEGIAFEDGGSVKSRSYSRHLSTLEPRSMRSRSIKLGDYAR